MVTLYPHPTAVWSCRNLSFYHIYTYSPPVMFLLANGQIISSPVLVPIDPKPIYLHDYAVHSMPCFMSYTVDQCFSPTVFSKSSEACLSGFLYLHSVCYVT